MSFQDQDQTCPLESARRQAGLSLARLAKHFGKSRQTIYRWCLGRRRAPDKFVLALCTLAGRGLSEEYARWWRERKTRRPTLTVSLPPGLDRITARRVCVEALASFQEGAGK